MRKRMFTPLHLLLAVVLTAALCIGGALLAVQSWLGPYGASLVRALNLVEERFVGEYDETAAVDSALEGLVAGLGDRWSYTLTAEELAAQDQRRSNQYVGVGVTVNYTSEDGLLILEVAAGGPAEAGGLLPGEVITAVDLSLIHI